MIIKCLLTVAFYLLTIAVYKASAGMLLRTEEELSVVLKTLNGNYLVFILI